MGIVILWSGLHCRLEESDLEEPGCYLIERIFSCAIDLEKGSWFLIFSLVEGGFSLE